MYDVIIIGAGYAGTAAGVYCAKNKIKALLLDGGLSKLSDHPIAGPEDLSDDFFNVYILKQFFNDALINSAEILELQKNQQVINLEKNVVSFSVEVRSGKFFYGKTVIIAVGNTETSFDLLTHKDVEGKIKVGAAMETNIQGIFAAGDVTVGSSGDYFLSAAQGAQAVLSALKFLKEQRH